MSSDRPEESFAALFEQTTEDAPRRRGPRVGETLSVLVVQVGRDAVFVELDGRRQGFIEANDLRAPMGRSRRPQATRFARASYSRIPSWVFG